MAFVPISIVSMTLVPVHRAYSVTMPTIVSNELIATVRIRTRISIALMTVVAYNSLYSLVCFFWCFAVV